MQAVPRFIWNETARGRRGEEDQRRGSEADGDQQEQQA
jgi:hypothetical protein